MTNVTEIENEMQTGRNEGYETLKQGEGPAYCRYCSPGQTRIMWDIDQYDEHLKDFHHFVPSTTEART